MRSHFSGHVAKFMSDFVLHLRCVIEGEYGENFENIGMRFPLLICINIQFLPKSQYWKRPFGTKIKWSKKNSGPHSLIFCKNKFKSRKRFLVFQFNKQQLSFWVYQVLFETPYILPNTNKVFASISHFTPIKSFMKELSTYGRNIAL